MPESIEIRDRLRVMGVCKNRTYVRVIGRGTADGDPRNSMGAFCRASWYAICAAKRSSSCAIRQHAHIASLNNRNTLQRAFLATRPRGTITAAPSLLNTRARRYRLVYRAAALTARGHVNPARVEDDHPALGNSKRERWGARVDTGSRTFGAISRPTSRSSESRGRARGAG